MITVCEGWEQPHPTVVLVAEDNGRPGVSHGICPECTADVLQAEERRAEFRMYTELNLQEMFA